MKYKLITFTLVLLILCMSGLIVYMLYGDRIRSRFDFTENGVSFIGSEGSGTEDTQEENPEENGEPEALPEDETVPEEETQDSEPQNNESQEEEPPLELDPNLPLYSDVRKLPTRLTLNIEDFTARSLGAVTPLEASGGSGEYTWISQDPRIATVDQEGKVTTVSNGIVNILVTDGESKGICVVRVYSGMGNSEDSENQLNRTDFTRLVSEGPFQLRVSGVSEGLSWRSLNPAVASVSDAGLVTPVAPGTTDIIVSWGDQSRVCTVRVPKETALPAEQPAPAEAAPAA